MEIDTGNKVQIYKGLIQWPVGKYFKRSNPQTLRSEEIYFGPAYWYFSLSTQIIGDKFNYLFQFHKDRVRVKTDYTFHVRLNLRISANLPCLSTTGWCLETEAQISVLCLPSQVTGFYNAVLSCSINGVTPLDQLTHLDIPDEFLPVIGSRTHGSKAQEEKEVPSQSIPKLIEDLKKLLNSKENSDVVLKVNDKEFPAHRLILEARSPVFAAMFKHDTAEKQSGVVNIEECDLNTFPEFLYYIYTGKVENLSPENVHHLYTAADRYEVMELKKDCMDYMKNNMSVDNLCDFLSLALLYGETELVNIATEFFLKNASNIVMSAKWLSFLAQNCVAGNELIVKVITKKAME